MVNLLRMIIGLLGTGSMFLAASLWFNTSNAAKSLGLSPLPDNLVGLATIRTDIGGLFAGMGLLFIAASVLRDTKVAWCALILAACAFTGRMISLLTDGSGPTTFGPFLIEILAIALLFAATRVWRKT
jgi:hypothetical protein